MKTLFGGLFLETAGLIWDTFRHLGGSAGVEGLVYKKIHIQVR